MKQARKVFFLQMDKYQYLAICVKKHDKVGSLTWLFDSWSQKFTEIILFPTQTWLQLHCDFKTLFSVLCDCFTFFFVLSTDSSVGAGIDSYYEYCLKAYILLGDDTYLERFNRVSCYLEVIFSDFHNYFKKLFQLNEWKF